MVVSESDIRCIFFFSELHLEENEEYENYLRITTECFGELYVLVKNEVQNMRDANTPEGKLAQKNFMLIHLKFYFLIFFI